MKHRVRNRVTTLLGQQRIEYLESLPEAPAAEVRYRDITTRIVESRVLDNGLTALVDLMMQDDIAASAQMVIRELEHVIRLLS